MYGFFFVDLDFGLSFTQMPVEHSLHIVLPNLSKLYFGVIVSSVLYLRSVSFICMFPKKSMAQTLSFRPT